MGNLPYDLIYLGGSGSSDGPGKRTHVRIKPDATIDDVTNLIKKCHSGY